MTSTSEVLSAISAGRLLPHADSILLSRIYCPAEIKEIAEIIVTGLREVLSALSAISTGRLLLHADSSFIVPQSSALPLRSSKK